MAESHTTTVPVPSDTIDDETARILRRLNGVEKLRLASAMYSGARPMLLHHVRERHPDWDEQRIATEAARSLARSPS